MQNYRNRKQMIFLPKTGDGRREWATKGHERTWVMEVFYILIFVYTFAKTLQIIQVKRMNFMLVDYTE